jgi:mannitol-1-/sugar-/sorbitol-6-phosphatase
VQRCDSHYVVGQGVLSPGICAQTRAEQRHAGDGVQRALRSRFPPRLMPRRWASRRGRMEMNFAAVIFDLDGVLVDSNAIAKRQMRVWAEMHQIPFQRIAEVLHGQTTVETIRLAALHLDAEHEATVIEALERQHANELVAFMGAGRLLSTIDPGRWAIATNSTRESALLKLTHTGLPIPVVLVTAADVSKGKPAPDAYLLAAKRLGVNAASCAVVEDTPGGVEAGRAAGSYVIGVAATVPAKALDSAHVVLGCLDDLMAKNNGGSVAVSWGAMF